jgi:toxin ParE1/3/4
MSARKLPLTLAPDARTDFSDILLYSAQQWGTRQRNTYRAELLRGFAAIRDHPQLGTTREDLGPGIRSRLVEHHLVYYRVLDDLIEVVRILHERMDASRHFSG